MRAVHAPAAGAPASGMTSIGQIVGRVRIGHPRHCLHKVVGLSSTLRGSDR